MRNPSNGWEDLFLPRLWALCNGEVPGRLTVRTIRKATPNHVGALRACHYLWELRHGFSAADRQAARVAMLDWYQEQEVVGHMALGRGRPANQQGSSTYTWMYDFINAAVRLGAREFGHRDVLGASDRWTWGHVALQEACCSPAGEVEMAGAICSIPSSIERTVAHQLLTRRQPYRDARGRWGEIRSRWGCALIARLLDDGDDFGGVAELRDLDLEELAAEAPRLVSPMRVVKMFESGNGIVTAWCPSIIGSANAPQWAIQTRFGPHGRLMEVLYHRDPAPGRAEMPSPPGWIPSDVEFTLFGAHQTPSALEALT